MTTASINKAPPKKELYWILACSLIPMLAAWISYFSGFGVPKETVNHGRLVMSAPSLEGVLSKDDWARVHADKKWRVLHLVGAPCEAACEAALYLTRQIHIRLSQNSERVERIALVDPTFVSTAQREALQRAHPRLHILNVDRAQQQRWLSSVERGLAVAASDYWLVDQEGRAMMLYDAGQDGNDVLKDLKRVLKYSIDYQQ